MDKNEILNSDWEVRAKVAENPNTPADVLTELAKDSDYIVRCLVARDPKLKEVLTDKKIKAMFYEIKLKVEKENSKGEMKEVVEHFITDVELFAEAEAKGLERYNGDCDVLSITRSKVIEIVNEKEEDKPFYKATLIDIFIDDNGNEKETKYYNLVCAKDITEANRLMQEHMRQGLNDMRLDGIVKTKIIDLI